MYIPATAVGRCRFQGIFIRVHQYAQMVQLTYDMFCSRCIIFLCAFYIFGASQWGRPTYYALLFFP